MRSVLNALLIATLTLSTTANAAGWLCVTEKTTGFSFNKTTQEWEEASFKAEQKYIIRSSTNDRFLWEVKVLGDNSPLPHAYCRDNPNEVGTMVCEGIGGTFRLNTKNGRLLHVYPFGYWTYDPKSEVFANEGGDTPAISIGRCSAI